MNANNLFAAVDIGTTKTRVLVGECALGKLNVLGYGEAPQSGAKRGRLTDTHSAQTALRNALHAAEKMAGVPAQVRRSYIAVSGEHLRGGAQSGVASVAGPTVTRDDLTRAVNDAAVPRCDDDRVLIQHLRQGWRVDGRLVTDPLGRPGKRVESDHWRIEADAAEIRRLVALAADLGAPVREFFPASLASAQMASTEDERRAGVLTVDIGASVTDYALFLDGRIRLTGALPLGGDDLTQDYRTAHKMRLDDAETLKIKVARAYPPAEDANALLLFSGGQGAIGGHRLTAGAVHGAAEARMRAILGHIRDAVAAATGEDAPARHCVLTGDAASQTGLAELAASVLGMRCERICDREWKGEPYSDPEHATVMGVLELASAVETESRRRLAADAAAASGRFLRWYRRSGIHTLFPL